MTAKMRFIGPEPRARDVRSAANRLRWEIDYLAGRTGHENRRPGSMAVDALGVVPAIAETLALLRQTLTTIEQGCTPDHREIIAEILRADLLHYQRYHEVAR